MNQTMFLGIVIAALLAGNAGQALYTKNVKADRDRYKTERNQARADGKLCQDDKALTLKVANANKARFDDLARRVDARERVRGNPKCKPITTARPSP